MDKIYVIKLNDGGTLNVDLFVVRSEEEAIKVMAECENKLEEYRVLLRQYEYDSDCRIFGKPTDDDIYEVLEKIYWFDPELVNYYYEELRIYNTLDEIKNNGCF